MGCGCGGSTSRQTARQKAAQAKPASGSTTPAPGSPGGAVNEPGYYAQPRRRWNGPERKKG